jgi:two-component system NarL family sensor kinase
MIASNSIGINRTRCGSSAALSGLREVAQRLREVTFVLHPAVLEQVGLAEAAKKVVSVAQSRSGIDITADVHSSIADSTDAMVFAVLRE